jgi:hypothetical protein
MTQKEWYSYHQQAIDGTISDENNPALIFQVINHHLLLMAANGEIDLNEIAKLELKARDII